jgi:muramoyltetrapeptide carboxypeptidase
VRGPLFPVCLTLLTSLLGTSYVPDLSGAILVIEDVHEELYAVDRALTQLRLAGVLNRLAAVLVGSFNGVEGQDELLAVEVPRLVCEMTPETVPVASGVAYGHIPRRLTLPVGALASADFERSVVVVEE